MAEIELKHIKKVYLGQEKAVINDYNLKISDKEFVVFVGPSGSGKSTVLRMIAGLNSITSGDLYFDGQRMNDIAPKDRGIAMVFQDYALYPHMTVYQNIAFPLKIAKTDHSELDSRVKKTAALMGLTNFLDRKPLDLSGGQRQRVAIAGAIVRGSKILLMDEPLSNLDAKLRVQARSDIAQIHRQIGSTTIYVTHDQTEAMTLADKIVLIDHGDIQQVGSPSEMYSKPANLFVATFIGSPEMNIFNVFYHDGKIENKFGLSLELPKPIIKKLNDNNLQKKEIYFGVRPEDIHAELVALGAYKQAAFEIDIRLSELLGESSLLHFNYGGNNDVVAKIKSNALQHAGEKIKLAFDLNKSHFFTKENRQERVV
ncbi:ABC transporter ATP-binding protein [Oenococcus sicerae]|uniref:ABC transporter ATP-binding protein n=1 Tax=Oenococcus sicerae TaxID=2203724 RepID=A0AAJ1R8V1_9LACO|nr:ABC transporter ATP-binding protein [Oenococcus sicerae]MDN6900183.1 ABC transporter ATP-binding protein [Oenococcus sicerae]